jgi:hypothetical protein
MRWNELTLSFPIVLPTMVKAGDLAAADEAETQAHTAMRATILPGMRNAIGIAPEYNFLVKQPRAGRAPRLNPI